MLDELTAKLKSTVTTVQEAKQVLDEAQKAKDDASKAYSEAVAAAREAHAAFQNLLKDFVPGLSPTGRSL